MIARFLSAFRFALRWEENAAELATLRAEVRDLRRRERALFEAARELRDQVERIELQRDVALALAERVIDQHDAENILQ